jgi:hypothetical protein
VKLQRDWKVDAESLPFARCVKGHALVSLVQKGLRYHHLSLTIDEVLASALPKICRACSNHVAEWPAVKTAEPVNVFLRAR